MQSQLVFPQHMDMPGRILFWTVDQIVPFSAFMMVGILTKTLLICVTLGVIAGFAVSRYRNSRPDGYLEHMLYWYGVMPLKGRAVLNPFIRTVYPQ